MDIEDVAVLAFQILDGKCLFNFDIDIDSDKQCKNSNIIMLSLVQDLVLVTCLLSNLLLI